ncbi:MAG: aspartoacylase [Oscillatoriales cyanobacterium C42_A2020_001]|nr:aspartoacylase [Leptolyngbyaceae cyanobacterium C42_A2020_001]
MLGAKIHRVAIAGGTHGNEFTGIYLVKKFQGYPDLVQRPSFETVPLLTNPQAFALKRRYAEQDLNRCFLPADLQSSTSTSYEALRAKELYQTLVAQPESKADFILDLHTTTANMGLTVILVNHHPFNLRLAAHLSAVNSAVKIYSAYQPGKTLAFLNSLCEFGFAIEVGAIAQGTLRADLFQRTEALIHTLLDYLDAANRNASPPVASSLTIYQHLRTVDYPKDEHGELLGMIHPRLQDQDYQPLHPGAPLFLTFDGDVICYEGDATVYPIFINEAAYYEKGIALCLTEQQTLEL